MSNDQIPNLPPTIALSGPELFEVVQGGTSQKVTTALIAQYAVSTYPYPILYPVPIAQGGTGQTTKSTGFNALSPITSTGDLIIGGGANLSTRLPLGGAGTVLASDGSIPSWTTLSGVAVTTLSFGTTGLTPAVATSGPIVVAGTLVAANGGTGQSTYTIGDILYASGASALSKLAGVATGNVLLSGGIATAPSWGKVDLTGAVSGLLPVANGGTGAGSFTANGIVLGNGTSALGVTAAGTTGQILVGNTGSAPTWTALTGAAVTTISFGTMGLTPNSATSGAVTVSGTLVAANGGTGLNTYAVGDIPYASTTSALSRLADVATGSAIISGGVGVAPSYGKIGLTTHVSGTLAVGNGGIGVATLTGIPLGNGTAAFTVAAAGTDYAKPNTASTWTATQTFNGSASALAMVLANASETTTVAATAATGTINFDLTTQSITYYTSNAAANWTTNFRASSGTSLNTAMATGQTITAAFLVTQGGTAFYNNVIQIDGTAVGVTTKWQGGVAPSAGNINSIDAYTYSIIKTGSATFTIFASQTKFA